MNADWNDPSSIPTMKPGNMKEFIVAVYRAHSGKVYTFAATYLNGYGLNYESCPKGNASPYEVCEGCEDGCPTTGWFSQTGDEDEGSTFHAMNMKDGDQLMGWQELPKWNGAVPVAA
jgi:hypothetical protein